MDRDAQVIAELFALYERFGDSDYIGEPVSQIEHMSQAVRLARLVEITRVETVNTRCSHIRSVSYTNMGSLKIKCGSGLAREGAAPTPQT